MFYYDIRAIKKLSQNTEKFMCWFNQADLEPALAVLKMSSLYYNRFSEQSEDDYEYYFTRCIYVLLQRFPSDRGRVLRTESECRIIHQAYNDFFRRIRIMNKRNHTVTDGNNKLNAFLIFSEINLSIIYSLLNSTPSNKLEDIFPLIFRMDGLPLSENASPHNIKSINMIFDQVCSYTSGIFSQLRSLYPLNLEHHCSELAVNNTASWIKEWDDFDSLNRISDLFRFCNAKINGSDPENVSANVEKNCIYIAYEVARSRFMMREAGVYMDIQELLKKNPDFFTQLKPVVPKWINENDFLSVAFFSEMENMSPEDLCIEYGGVAIYAWIHAYEMLRTLAKQEMDKRFQKVVPGGLQLKEWVIYHTLDEWIQFFTGGGLSRNTAVLLTGYFTFDDRAPDMNDCPLLPCGDGLCMMPSVISMSSATRSLLSLFSAKNISVSDKGKSHEREFIRRVRNAGIRAAPLSVRKNYDCDCVMVIDDHLFFIELKSSGHPVHFSRYYQTLVNINGDHSGLDKKSSWIKQVTRYADYYAVRPELIRNVLNLPAEWQPEGVHKMIITTSILGDFYHRDGCYVSDKTAFYSFIERLAGDSTELKNGIRTRIRPESDLFYDGKITIEKIFGFLGALPSVTLKRRRVQQRTYQVRCGGINFTYPFFDIWPGYEIVVQEDGSEAVMLL